MAILNIHSNHLAFNDSGDVVNSNPKRVYFDWTRHVIAMEVAEPEIRGDIKVQPGEALTVFSGARTTSIDGTSVFGIALSTVKESVYRMTHSGGTAPAFRTARAYSPSGVLHTLTVSNNATMTVSIPSGNFNAVAGDTVYIPHTTTGDSASPFNVLNVGFWVVIAASATSMTLVRRVGESFVGVSEAVTPTTNAQVAIFSAAGVQVGDSLKISGGFSAVSRKTFVVSEVTPTWVEFTSTEALPLESSVTVGATSLTFYTASKRFIRIEADQDAIVRVNGDTGSFLQIAPLVAGDRDQMGHFELMGPVWQLVIVNLSTTATLKLTLLTCE